METLLIAAAFALLNSAYVFSSDLTLTSVAEHAVLGQPFQFRCQVENQDGTDGVVLFKLDTFSKCSVRRSTCAQFTPPDDGQFSCACADNTVDPVSYFLNISELTMDTLGPWLCENGQQSNEVELTATDPEGPNSVTVTPTSPVTVLQKQNLTLTCTAECIPDCVFIWTTLRNNAVVDVTDNGDRSLVLRDVSPDMSGDYTCLAVNPASNTSSNVTIELKVVGAPQLKADSSFVGTIYTTLGQKETLTVPFLSPLAPTFTWGKVTGGKLSPVQSEAGRELSQKQSGDVYTAMLSLTVTESDLGVFCVTGGNQAGQESVYIQLRTQDILPAPCVGQSRGHRTSLPPLYLGLVIGIGGTLLIAVVFGVIGYCKHRQIRRELEHPYSSADRLGLENHYNKVAESQYQELPTPIFDRKLENEKKDMEDTDKMESPEYNVFANKNVGVIDPSRDCCVSIVGGKSLFNPMYNGLNPYPIIEK